MQCYAVSLYAVATILAGCGSAASQLSPSEPPEQSGPPLVVAHRVASARHHDGRPSWMAAGAKRMSLLYVTDANNGTVSIFSYPKGELQGTLTGFEEPYGDCTGKAGAVWIVDDETATITEYAHGGTSPIATLIDSGEYPAGCSVDPSTGNFAVTNYEGPGGGQGSVSIFKKAKGEPVVYTDSSISRAWFCSYDDSGNLFVDGDKNGTSGFQLAELPSGSGTFTNISIDQSITVAGGVQWDGKYLAVAEENEGPDSVYQFSISGSSGTEVTSTSLTGSKNVHQFWIDPARKRVIAPSASLGSAGYWKFPAGGDATKTLTGLDIPEAVVLSSPR
jgi:DNA-binding beta-propeller fold protein YncE